MKSLMIAAAAFAALATAGAALAETQTYAATLAAGPGITTTGKGTAAVTYDTVSKALTYKVDYDGLTGPATMAHIHGPADPGANAGVQVPFTAAGAGFAGTATLTDAQAADLQAGKYYVNVHTAANRGGEIRGQLVKK
jgi:Cu/Zn superoxide dismutase